MRSGDFGPADGLLVAGNGGPLLHGGRAPAGRTSAARRGRRGRDPGEYARPGGYGHGSGGGSDVRSGDFGPADGLLVAGSGGPLLHGGRAPAGRPPAASAARRGRRGRDPGEYARPGGYGHGSGGGSDVRSGDSRGQRRLAAARWPGPRPEGSGVVGGGGTQTAHGVGSPNSRLGGPGTFGDHTDPATGLPTRAAAAPAAATPRTSPQQTEAAARFRVPDGDRGIAHPRRPARQWQGGRPVRSGTMLTLTPDPGTPLFGYAVNLTAAVARADRSASRTVRRLPPPCRSATASPAISTAWLQPGSHTVTAHYSGSGAARTGPV